jgi:hypothetical protein
MPFVQCNQMHATPRKPEKQPEDTDYGTTNTQTNSKSQLRIYQQGWASNISEAVNRPDPLNKATIFRLICVFLVQGEKGQCKSPAY